MARNLPKNITKTKYGFHVRMEINGEYHAEHFVEADYKKGVALKKAKEKRQELIELRKRKKKKGPKKYDTRFLYENPNNSTGIIGVFHRFEQGKNDVFYPYICTTIIAEKGKPKSYSRSIKRWGMGEALLQICCIRKRHMVITYGDRFDSKRFDESVLFYMKENYLSYTDDALKRLSNCTAE